LTLRWLNPQGTELWSTTGELQIAPPPLGVTEMDMPLIAALDLPLDQVGGYTMSIALDETPRASVALMVRTAAALPITGPGMLS
jgi:hypothetical protein